MLTKMIIFDLDGTLWDSAHEVAEAWNVILQNKKTEWIKANEAHRCFAEKIPFVTDKMMKSVMGKTMEEIEISFMPDANPEIRYAVFRECECYEVEHIIKTGSPLYEGVEDTLKRLTESGYKLAIVSNCQKDYVKAFMISMKMEEYFCDYEEWGRTLLPKSENIKLVMERNGYSRNVVYVGDTQKDCDASLNAGVPFIWAKYGFGQVTEADGVINSICELPDILAAAEFWACSDN